jgi:hypothetical protein
MAKCGPFLALVSMFLLPSAGSWAASTARQGPADEIVQLVDVQSAHTLPRGTYSLGLRAVPAGGILAGLRVAVTDYVLVGLSYGAANFVGSGEPAWDKRAEFEVKLRLAEEDGVIPALAVGYDSRGYGLELERGGYEKASQGFYVAATKTLPFSEYWQLHGGVSRTMEEERTGPDFFVGATARFSQEFSVIAEFQTAVERKDREDDSRTGYLNAGLRWIFMGELELDLYFRNLVGPSGSPELSSRSLAFVYYDSF